jgi:hypothetical protein
MVVMLRCPPELTRGRDIDEKENFVCVVASTRVGAIATARMELNFAVHVASHT